MFWLEIGPGDLAASRFAISPIHEAVVAVRALAGIESGVDATVRQWLEPKRAQFERLRRNAPMVGVLVELLSASTYTPTFLAPPPSRSRGALESQLEAVRATPLPLARAEIAACLSGSARPLPLPVRAVLAEPDIAIRLADALEAAWNELIRPDWPVIHTILQQDQQHWARRLLSQGWPGVLRHMPMGRLSWRASGSTQTLHGPDIKEDLVVEHCEPGSGGIVFGPTLAAGMSAVLDPGWQREIRYPALGRATLFQPSQRSQPASDPLGKLIGHTRARLLCGLDQPTTTTQLARLHRLSLGTVAHHLSAMRDAGLITCIRDGPSVIYYRTLLGDALVDANLL
ncbi:MAG TPA: winged helix-turn-helix domain-containing protein [Actinomycetota bacterium]